MELTKHFAAGIALGLLLAACAGAQFPYKYYGVNLNAETLQGPTPADDLGLVSTCAANSSDASPCTGMLTSQFLALKQDYINKANELETCQQQLAAK